MKPLVIAHRGASADAPQNTPAAFRLAWEQGADGIEGDFRLTADGHIVCMHETPSFSTAASPVLYANGHGTWFCVTYLSASLKYPLYVVVGVKQQQPPSNGLK